MYQNLAQVSKQYGKAHAMDWEYHMDEWYVMTSYVAGLLHLAMFSYLITIILLKEVSK